MLSLDTLLKWIGYLSGVIGLIRAAYFFFNEQVVGGLLTVLTVLVVLAAIIVIRRLVSLPPFTILNTEKTLTFEDRDGHKASHVDEREVRANHKGPTEYWYKELGIPNALENILVDDNEPDDEETELNLHRVCKRFQHSLGWRQTFETKLTLDIIGAFPDSRETYIHKVVDDTNRATLLVKFHPERPCIGAEVFVGYGGGSYEPVKDARFIRPRAQLTRSHDGRKVELKLRKPQRGEYYRIEWDW